MLAADGCKYALPAPRNSGHDPLTNLLNRDCFLEEADTRLANDQPAALVLFDLDGFKDINDVLGHSTGDRLLVAVAQRLRENVRPDHILARVGGDRFALLIPGFNDGRLAYDLAGRLVNALRGKFDINGDPLLLDCSAGIAVAPHHGANVEALLMSAELSLYRAKDSGGGTIGFYEPHLRRQVEARRSLQAELRRAYEQNEFTLLYQPQVELCSGRITGAEALLRWNHPDRGQLAPAHFLDVLEQMPLAASVGNWVLDTAIAQAAAWLVQGLRLRVGVNLFGAQFRIGDLPEFVASRLQHHGVPPRYLELELTETVAIKDGNTVASTLEALRQTGIGIALDDFGTGFASLSMLKKLAISRLKIDKSFVLDLAPGSCDAVLVDAIVKLGEAFGLEVIAEGIENVEQEHWLIDAKCKEGQGYMYGKPMPASHVAKAAGSGKTAPARTML